MSVAAFPRPAPMPASSSNHSSSGRVAIPRVMAARPAAMAPRPANMAPRPSSGNIATRPSQAQSQQPLQARSAAPTPPSNPRRQSNTSVASSSTASMAPPAPSPSASVVGAGGSKDTSSSSGKVFAKPSKEWVLPERAKPGRKVSVEEPDNKRQSQNRLSQRAHRARRTDYITTLEERLRQYEADEIHSNVRLQEVARALKADNERLKTEVAGLRDQVTDLSTQQQSWETERQGLESLIASLTNEVDAVNRVGGSTSLAISTSSRATARSRRSTKSGSPVERSLPTLVPDTSAQRETLDCPICPNPDPDCPCQQKSTQAPITMPRPTGSLAALTLAVKAMAEIEPVPTPGGSSSCGLCLSTDECLCRVVEEQDVKPTVFPTPSPELLDDDGDGCGLCTSASFCACKAAQNTFSQYDSPPVVARSKLPTPPNTYYPSPPSTVVAAVPLRLRRPTGQRTSAAPLWRLEPVAEGVAGPTSSFTATREDAVCSGDPSNCAACKDDRFGQEFCSNIFERVEEAPPAPAKTCNTCPPGSCMSINSLVSPPGSHYSPPHHHSTTADPASVADSSEADGNADTMTCDQAWKTLKAHPNSRFASLSLLADVVSGRTRSTGPVIDSTTPGPASSPASPAVAAIPTENTVPASRAVESTIAPISRKRNLAVETSAVRNALRLLDSTPTPAPSPGPVEDGDRDEKRRRIGV